MSSTFARRFWLIPVLLTGLLIGSSSCKSKQNLATATQDEVKRKSPKQLIRGLEESDFKFDWISIKSKAKAEYGGKKYNFKVISRIRQDSAIWMSVRVGPAEGLRVLLTKDSAGIIDRQNTKYLSGDYNAISDMLNVTVNYSDVEALLLGNSLAFDKSDAKSKSETDSTYHVLEQTEKRRAGDNSSAIISRFWIDPVTFKTVKLWVNDPSAGRSMEAIFGNFKTVDDQLFPHTVDVNIIGTDPVTLELEHTDIKVGEPQKMTFKIPKRYEHVPLQPKATPTP